MAVVTSQGCDYTRNSGVAMGFIRQQQTPQGKACKAIDIHVCYVTSTVTLSHAWQQLKWQLRRKVAASEGGSLKLGFDRGQGCA